MTADFYHFDMEFLGRAATRIINEVAVSTASSMT
jgi:GMP synthase (glutamine-hydrolysing)